MSIKEKLFLTKKEASQYLIDKGIPVSVRTLSGYLALGKGPAANKFGHRIFYTPSSLDQWIKTGLKPVYNITEKEASYV